MVVRGLNFEFAPLLHEQRRLHEGVACGGTEYLLYDLVVDVSRSDLLGLMISGFYWYTADGQILDAHQDKKGALSISPTILVLPGKHGVSHSSLILPPDVAVVWIVPEEPRG